MKPQLVEVAISLKTPVSLRTLTAKDTSAVRAAIVLEVFRLQKSKEGTNSHEIGFK